jgi:glycosyltransferase involved in cell wall biosynthesis
MDRALLSIIVPMRNAEYYIREALNSILCERETPTEVIIVDDQSTDGSLKCVQGIPDERIRVFKGPGAGISACLNVGLANANGSIVMRCDADDLFTKGRIARQVEWLSRHPEFDAVCGAFSTIDSKGNSVAILSCGSNEMEITGELQTGILRTHLCTFAIRSSLALKIGGFRKYFETAEDADFQLRLGEKGRIFYLPEEFYLYRLHRASITHTQHTELREHFSGKAIEFQGQRLTRGWDDLQKGSAPPKPSKAGSSIKSASEHIQGMLLGRAWNEYKNRKKLRAMETVIRAICARPSSVTAWKSLFIMIIKAVGVGWF